MQTCSRRGFLGHLTWLGTVAGLFAAKPVGSNTFPFAANSPADQDLLLTYLAQNAPKLLRDPQGVLKHPSIASSLPGAQYATNLWDWDTLWTCRGLFLLAKKLSDNGLHTKISEHAKGSLLNFFDRQSESGRMPIMITVKESDFFGVLDPHSPDHRNQAKPIFGQLALLLADEIKSVEWLRKYFDHLLRFYNSWTKKNLTFLGLFVWGDDVAIGDDNDPTTFGRPFFSSANLLLNCLMYQDLRAASELARRLGRENDDTSLGQLAVRLRQSIENYCWDERDCFYYTADVQCIDRRAQLIPNVKPGMAMSWHSLPLKIQMFTGFLPLWCGIPSAQRAQKLIHTNYEMDDRFRCRYGVRSLSSLEKMYSMQFSSNPSNWLGPVWIIVNYLVWQGLKRYGFNEFAEELSQKTWRLLTAGLAKDGSLNEYYHPETGQPLSHKGFMDWNLLVCEMA